MSSAASSKARYWRNVRDQKCVECSAGLQEGDGRRCVECAEKATRKSQANRKAENAATLLRTWRANRIARGQCPYCTEPLAPNRKACADHLAKGKARASVYQDRREARVA